MTRYVCNLHVNKILREINWCNEAMARMPGESLDSWLRKRGNKQQQVWRNGSGLEAHDTLDDDGLIFPPKKHLEYLESIRLCKFVG